MEILFSTFKSLKEIVPEKTISLEDWLGRIRGGKNKKIITDYRFSQDPNLKKSLPGATISGIFEKRSKMGCVQHSGLVCLDFDKVSKINKLRNEARKCDFTRAFFVSPGGIGLKVIVATNATIDTHEQVFSAVASYYSKFAQVDPSGKDVSRLCFESWDEQLYYRPDSAIFQYVPGAGYEETKHTGNYYETDYAWWGDFLNTRPAHLCDDRDNWLKLAMAIKAAGLPFEDFDYLASLSNGYKSTEDNRKMWDREHPDKVTERSLWEFARRAGFEFKGAGKKKAQGGRPTLRDNPEMKQAAKDEKEKKNTWTLAENYLLEKYEFRKNIVTQMLEFRDAGEAWDAVKDSHLERFSTEIRRCMNVNVKKDVIASLIGGYVMLERLFYDPISTTLNAIPMFSGYDVFFELAAKMNVSDRVSAELFLRKWFTAAVLQIRSTVEQKGNEIMLILQGGQGVGKNRFIDWAFAPWPAKYRASHAGGMGDKDALAKLSNYVVLHIEELSSFAKTRDVEEIKSFLSLNCVSYRAPYARLPETMKRYASCIGSTNDEKFLADRTGNRRFPVIQITDFIDFSQLPPVAEMWGYAKFLLHEKKETGFFSSSESVEISRVSEAYTKETSEQLFVDDLIDLAEEAIMVACADLLIYCNELGIRVNARQLGVELGRAGIKSKKVRDKSGRYYHIRLAMKHRERFYRTVVNRFSRESGGGDIFAEQSVPF